ncbi:MAG: hypothetical protein U9O98_03205 [Asgard group archaeon]|nr:hypothetical protein [Asgard group archaeon]
MPAQQLRTNIVQLIVFSLFSCLEVFLAIIFLVSNYYGSDLAYIATGSELSFGWLLSVFSLLLALLSLFNVFSLLPITATRFLRRVLIRRIVLLSNAFGYFLQITLLAICQLFYIPFSSGRSHVNVVMIGLSLLPPVILYFFANIPRPQEKAPVKPLYALSDDAPLRIRLTAFWLLFLTSMTQIFSTQWEIVVVGALLLLSTYLFFFLYEVSAILTPLVLIVLGSFLLLVSIVSFINLNELVISFQDMGFEYNTRQAIIVIVFFFIIPGIISFLLAQSFFRRWVAKWIREARPKKEISMEALEEETTEKYEIEMIEK